MRSSVETLDDNRVKLTVELDEAEFETEIEAAFKRIAQEVRMPGFRPGRAPRRLLEVQLGHQAGRAEALRASLPDYYIRALVKHEVDAIDAPQIDIVEGSETGPVCFDAVVEVRPTVEVCGYDALSVQIPSPVVDPDDIAAELDGFARQFAELSPVSRAAGDGDHLRIDIVGTLGGETIDGLTTSDYDYRLGAGAVVAEIDENLRGASAGDILEFEAAHPDSDEHRALSFRVLVKEVQETVLPELDDEFVAANSEYGTAEEFRAALHEARARVLALQALAARHEALTEAVAALVTHDVPEVLVDDEAQARLDDITEDLSRRGYGFDEYMTSLGQSREEFVAALRQGALRGVKLDLALRAVAAAEGLDADDGAIEAELLGAVSAANASGAETADGAAADARLQRETLASLGRLAAKRSHVSQRAALEWITERAELVDPDGRSVDPELLKLPEPDGRPAGSELSELSDVSEPGESPDAVAAASAGQDEDNGHTGGGT